MKYSIYSQSRSQYHILALLGENCAFIVRDQILVVKMNIRASQMERFIRTLRNLIALK